MNTGRAFKDVVTETSDCLKIFIVKKNFFLIKQFDSRKTSQKLESEITKNLLF